LLLLLGLFFPLLPQTNGSLMGQNLPGTGQQVFADDFVTTGFPTQWQLPEPTTQAQNVNQQGGYLVTVDPSSLFATQSALQINVVANTTVPLVDIQQASSQFVQIVFKMQAVNLTNPQITHAGSNYPAFAEVLFGLINGTGGVVQDSAVYFDTWWGTAALNDYSAGLGKGRTAIFVKINRPMPSAANTESMLYSSQPTSSIDLTAQHIFTIQMEVDKTNATNTWVRYNIDNNAWMGYNQIACSCITGPTGNLTPLFPFIQTNYLINVASPSTASQSLASQVDYVFAWNFVPSSLPS